MESKTLSEKLHNELGIISASRQTIGVLMGRIIDMGYLDADGPNTSIIIKSVEQIERSEKRLLAMADEQFFKNTTERVTEIRSGETWVRKSDGKEVTIVIVSDDVQYEVCDGINRCSYEVFFNEFIPKNKES